MTSFTWHNGEWFEGEKPVLSPSSNGVWLGSTVFDGARAFEGVAPDLDLHCARSIRSARFLGMEPKQSLDEIYNLAWEGIEKHEKEVALYIRPTFWADEGFIAPDPDSTQFALAVVANPMPDAAGFSACLSTLRRPTPESAPTDAKAACLYPNAGRAMIEAKERGFDNAVMLDAIGNVAEYATSNIFLVKDGVISTPAPNGSFLNGFTRQRVISLLKKAGHDVQERRVTVDELNSADEIFNTGNYGKVIPCIRFEDNDMQPGPIAKLSRELYWDYAHSNTSRVISAEARKIAA